ncbi:MAG: c-type cytochrome [Phycisphaerales bacterium]
MNPDRAITMRLALAACAALALGGCRGDREDAPPRQFFPDMDDSPKWKPQSQSDFFADGRAMRPLVDGVVPSSRWALGATEFAGTDGSVAWAQAFRDERTSLLKEDSAVYSGLDAQGLYVERIPIPVTEALMARGRERFNIYCSACHGYSGDGQGMVAQKWAAPVPSFHDPKYIDMTEAAGRGRDGFIFYTAMHGVPGPDGFAHDYDPADKRLEKMKAMKMPGYAHALSERDAWAITAYIRALQEKTTLEQIPEPRRAPLEQERARLTAPPPAPAPVPAAAPGAAPSSSPAGAKP